MIFNSFSVSDYTQAENLIKDTNAKYMLADKDYDADYVTPTMEMAWSKRKQIIELFCDKISEFYVSNESALDNMDIRIGVDITNAGYNEGLVAITKRNIEVAAYAVSEIVNLRERVAARSGYNRGKINIPTPTDRNR